MMRVTTSDSAFVSAFGGIRFYQLVPSQYSNSAPPCSDNQSDGSHPVSVVLTSNSAPHQYLLYSLCVYAEKRLHWLLLVVCNVCLHSSWMKRTRCLQGFSLITLIIAISSDPRASLVTKLRSHGSLGGLPRRVQATCIRTIRLLSLLSIACASVPFLLCLLMTFLSRITCVLSCLRARRTHVCPSWTWLRYMYDQSSVSRFQHCCVLQSFFVFFDSYHLSFILLVITLISLQIFHF